MTKKKATGAAKAAGRAEPCPVQTFPLHKLRPFLGKTEAQTGAIVNKARGGSGEDTSRVLQDLFTVRTDATLGDVLDTIGHLLYQAEGMLRVIHESNNTPDPLPAAIWGVGQLIEQAQAALTVVDELRYLEVTVKGAP